VELSIEKTKIVMKRTQTPQQNPPMSFVEYFAGIGLVRLGLEMAGWQVAFANDFDPNKYEMYQAAFAEHDTVYHVEDIFALQPASIPTATLATCSFPCIDLSLAGNQGGINGKHSSAFWGFINILKEQAEAAPPILLIENVTGWLNSNKGKDFQLTISTLNDLGYACDVFELDARRFTPQSRPRIFVVAFRTDEPNSDIGRFSVRPSSLTSKRVRSAVMSNLDLKWHFLKIPPPPNVRDDGFSAIAEKLDKNDSRWWDDEKVEHHLNMMAGSHFEYIQNLKSKSHLHYRTVFRRMRSGEQRAEVRKSDTAGCLRTARGGSSRQIVIAVGQGEICMRQMTSREYARLQGVPDWFPIQVEEIQALTGFGDAVCVPAITWIAEKVLNPLSEQLLTPQDQLAK
jgi:DNA (cytosine-5)-methyltransferase 1